MPDSYSRFTRTVENYLRYRPAYPPAAAEFLQDACRLAPAAVIADIGSGTGLLAQVFLRQGYRVIGVEPNPEMRAAGQHFLRDFPRFTSVAGTAEETTLGRQSVDMITAGQAFHWLDRARARQEFSRLIKPGGWVVLAWNVPRRSTPFLAAYDRLWRKYLDPQAHTSDMDTEAFDSELRAWYAPGTVNLRTFDNSQVVDFEGLKGRVLSSSYAPTPERPEHAALLAALETVFQSHQLHGQVTLEYECRVCYGRLG